MNVTIRKASTNDITNILELNKKCLPIYYSYFEYLVLMMSSTYLISVAEIDNKIIGYMVGEFHPLSEGVTENVKNEHFLFHDSNKNFHIMSIGVDDKVRNKGVGTLLITKLIDYIKGKYDNITLFVHDENEKAIQFYIKNGFVKISHLSNYYEGSLKTKSQGAFKMQKFIDNK